MSLTVRSRALAVLATGFALLGACGEPASITRVEAQRHAIIDGTLDTDTFPEVGALIAFGPGESVSLCSATLIETDVILTAAHCVTAFPQTPTDEITFVFVLDADARPALSEGFLGGRTVELLHLEAHPEWSAAEVDQTEYSNDLALGILATEVTDIPPATLATAEMAAAMQSGDPITSVGYGRSDDLGFGSTGERRWSVMAAGEPTPSVISLWNMKTPVCNGDSGGPSYLIDEATGDRWLAGVHSRLRGVVDGCMYSIGYATRPDAFFDWIAAIEQESCTAGLRPSCLAAETDGGGSATTDGDGNAATGGDSDRSAPRPSDGCSSGRPSGAAFLFGLLLLTRRRR